MEDGQPQEEVTREGVLARIMVLGACSLEVADDLYRVHKARLYRTWGFKQFRDWVSHDCDGTVSKAQAYRMVMVRRVFGPWWDDVKRAAMEGKTGMHRLSDVAVVVEQGKCSAEEAAAYVLDGDALPEQAQKEKLHQLKAVPKELHDLMEQAKNVARFYLEKDAPSDTDALEWMIVEAMGQARPLLHTTSDGVKFSTDEQDMLEGKIRCGNCGCWDRTKLDPHHVIPRSTCKLPEGRNQIVLLCRECHQIVQPIWKVWAQAHGWAELVAENDLHSRPSETGTDSGDSLSL